MSQVYDYQHGELPRALQSLHVHLLGWVTYLPGSELDQVKVGRYVMLLLLCGTCALIYRLCRVYFTPAASAVSVLAFASAGPTMIHGASFRVDPISAFFIMVALVTLAKGRPSLGTMLLAGGSAAIAGMITIKVGLYAPAFLGIAAWRLRNKDERKEVLKWLAGTAIAAAAMFLALYGMQLALVEKASNAGTQAILEKAAQDTLVHKGFLPHWDFTSSAAKISTIQVIFLLTGAVGVIVAFIRKSEDRFRLFAIGCCGATLLCVLFYRNVYPYFFPFILPPAMLLVAWPVDRFAIFRRPLWLGVAAVAFLLPALLISATWLMREKTPQRQIVDAVHRMFPQPVPMIDQSHMISSFPKRGFFMSTWGVASYRRKGEPIFAGILQRETVPLLLLDGPVLAMAVGVNDREEGLWVPEQPLFDEDARVLRENYVEHWGPIWVAGKRLDAAASRQFEILIPGDYTLEGGALSIDGKPVASGGVINLARGTHRFESDSNDVRTLRWGRALAKPSGQAPQGRVYTQFFGWDAKPQPLPGRVP